MRRPPKTNRAIDPRASGPARPVEVTTTTPFKVALGIHENMLVGRGNNSESFVPPIDTRIEILYPSSLFSVINPTGPLEPRTLSDYLRSTCSTRRLLRKSRNNLRVDKGSRADDLGSRRVVETEGRIQELVDH
ncbi:hypothetical protein KPH14_005915 [Odynerus spinipes]|uniref:Uncharacterized protein n=1 Tax=Odynerus spinipes TaxID=1348599 RepID=A0AAD9VN75_9HYME|nr:hypothetical protein KPH14_005915 [Odynerus spinipes]